MSEHAEVIERLREATAAMELALAPFRAKALVACAAVGIDYDEWRAVDERAEELLDKARK